MRLWPAIGMVGLGLLAACTPEPKPVASPRPATTTALEPRADWSMELPRLMPGITVCLDKAGPAVAVTKAWPIGLELTGARLLEADGKRIDCVAAGDGSAVLLVEPVRVASVLSGERDPLYTPGAAAPPRTSCLDTTPVQDQAGGDLGWLSYDGCGPTRTVKPSAQVEPPRRAAPRDGAG